MNLDLNSFTPMTGLIGGLLIGAGAAILMVINGRIAGISGIMAELMRGRTPAWQEHGWRLAFVIGLIAAPWLYRAGGGTIDIVQHASPWIIVVSGVLIGFGARLGAGCTSGHGVCGLPRLSSRSAMSVVVFFSMAILTTTLTRLFF